jgi:hypothetical protein
LARGLSRSSQPSPVLGARFLVAGITALMP